MRGKLIQKHGPTQTASVSRVSLINLLNPVCLIPCLSSFLLCLLLFSFFFYIRLHWASSVDATLVLRLLTTKTRFGLKIISVRWKTYIKITVVDC